MDFLGYTNNVVYFGFSDSLKKHAQLLPDNQSGHTCIFFPPSHDHFSHMFKLLQIVHFHSVFTENMF